MPDNDEKNETFGPGTFISDIETVQSKCIQAGMKDLFLYKGVFADSANELKKNISEKVAIVNVDGDLYESAKDSLTIIEPFLQVGTGVLFDDYNTFCADNLKGERRALREFSENTGFQFEKWFTYHYVGQAFLCVEK